MEKKFVQLFGCPSLFLHHLSLFHKDNFFTQNMSKTKTEDVEMKDAAKPEVEEDPETKKRRAEKEAFDLLVAGL